MKHIISLSLVMSSLLFVACDSNSSRSSRGGQDEKDQIVDGASAGFEDKSKDADKSAGSSDRGVAADGANGGTVITDNSVVVQGADGQDGKAGSGGISVNGVEGAVVTRSADGKPIIFVGNGGSVTIGNETIKAPANGCIAIVNGKMTEGKSQAECDKIAKDLGITDLVDGLLDDLFHE